MTTERLSHLERVIGQNRRCFYRIGKALAEIRNERLYSALLFESFDAYTKTRWDMGKSHAYRLIQAWRVIDNLSPIGDVLPENESQVRPLAQLEELDQRRIWRDFVASGIAQSALNIKSFVSKRTGATGNGTQIDRSGIISDGYKQAVVSLLNQIRLAEQDQWQSTSREAALFWIKVLKEKILLTATRPAR